MIQITEEPANRLEYLRNLKEISTATMDILNKMPKNRRAQPDAWAKYLPELREINRAINASWGVAKRRSLARQMTNALAHCTYPDAKEYAQHAIRCFWNGLKGVSTGVEATEFQMFVWGDIVDAVEAYVASYGQKN